MNNHKRKIMLVAGIVGSLLVSAFAGSNCYISFDGGFLKSLPAKTSAYSTINGVKSSISTIFTAGWDVDAAVGTFSFTFSGKTNSDWWFGTDWVQVPNDYSNDVTVDNFSIEFWVKTASTKSNNCIIDKRLNGSGYHVTLYYGSPLLQLENQAIGGSNYYNYGVKVNDGLWHKIQFIVNRSSVDGGKILVDGIGVHTFNPMAYSGRSISSKEPLWIGRHVYNMYYNFEGKIDDLRIWRQN